MVCRGFFVNSTESQNDSVELGAAHNDVAAAMGGIERERRAGRSHLIRSTAALIQRCDHDDACEDSKTGDQREHRWWMHDGFSRSLEQPPASRSTAGGPHNLNYVAARLRIHCQCLRAQSDPA